MTDKSLIDRLNRMVKIVPQDSEKGSKTSWGSERKTLTTEQKIYAISNGMAMDEDGFIPRERKRKKWKEIIRKCLNKCPWGVPWIMIVFSAIQVSD